MGETEEQKMREGGGRCRGETERFEVGPLRGSGGGGPTAPKNGAFFHRDQKRRLAQEQVQLHRRGG